jgi:hypothetical protein
LCPEKSDAVQDGSKFVVPAACRTFETANFEERLSAAETLIEAFVEKVAPPLALDDKNEEWTKSVRGRFIDICPSDCDPSPKDRCTSKGEFLVDYTWEEKRDGKRILLASESEWATDRFGKVHWCFVEEDFEKLLSVKAIFKVLIFSSDYSKPGCEGDRNGDFSIGFAKKRIADSLKNYGHHMAGEVYVFIDFPHRAPISEGLYRSFIWIVKKHGTGDLEFHEDGKDHKLHRPT